MNRFRLLRSRLVVLAFFLFLAAAPACQKKVPAVSGPPHDTHLPYNFIGKSGMVVAAHPLAAKAGLETLKKGGNAVDAAVATAFALNAAEPFASGIGGGGFMVLYIAKDKKVTVINFREKAPSQASPEIFLENGEINEHWKTEHGLAVAVPGALAGWGYALEKYGTQNLDEVIAEAVEIAEKGFSVGSTFSTINKDEYEKLLLNDGESTCYLNSGFPYEPGDTFRNPELAQTFKAIASKGIQEFYRGELAHKIVRAVTKKGGILTLEDLADYRVEEVSPLKGTYKGYTICTIPPPGSGGLHIIQLLNIIENWPVKDWGPYSPAYIHHFSEALRFVFADRIRYLGDPDFIFIPVMELTSKKYAAQIAGKIKDDRILDQYPYSQFEDSQNTKDNTTHLCVVDREGNIVAQTQSINHFFGSGIVPQQTGFLLNNHMDDFSVDPDSPNSPGSNRRPLSSMGPLILFKGENPFLVLGSPGGTRIFPSLTQIIVNIVDFGMELDEAIEAPRFFTSSSHEKATDISLESRMPQALIEALRKLGNSIQIREAYDKYFGGAQGILLFPGKKLIYGGADSRRDGFGAGY